MVREIENTHFRVEWFTVPDCYPEVSVHILLAEGRREFNKGRLVNYNFSTLSLPIRSDK